MRLKTVTGSSRNSLADSGIDQPSALFVFALHDLQPHVTRVLVCDLRKNALLKVGNKNDRIGAGKLPELLYPNKLSQVYHGEPGTRTLKELARSYIAVTCDLTRVISRLKPSTEVARTPARRTAALAGVL
jgi:hypothetical protein